MSELSTRHYKETTPEATIDKIKSILDMCGIEVEEKWAYKSELETYSLSLYIKGTTIGSNGKGVTETYCRASAYAEFIERYQNTILTLSHSSVINNEFPFYLCFDEKYMTSAEIVDDNNSIINHYLSKCNLKDANREERIDFVQKNFKLSDYVYGSKEHICLPYYNINEDKLVYLSPECSIMLYGSNGMAAGNTPEEALIQGLSEIYERYVQTKVILEGITLPDVPLEVIQSYPEIYEMYKRVTLLPNIEIKIKDASLGGKYPVAAMIVIEKNSGTFGIKFGSHADFGIAMERTFTEVTQGRSLSEYAIAGTIDFEGIYSKSEASITNAMKTGNAYYPYQLLLNRPTYDYAPVKDISGFDNKQILDYMVNIALDDGHEILIRDVSMLGFPSYHIIIPTISEMFEANALQLRVKNTLAYITKSLNEVDTIDARLCKLMIGVITFQKDRLLENQLHSYLGFNCKNTSISVNAGEEGYYLLAMAYIFIGDYTNAYITIHRIVEVLEHATIDEKYQKYVVYYKALEVYLRAMSQIKNHTTAIELIKELYTEDIYTSIDDYFSDTSQLFVKQYTKHSFRHADGRKCSSCCDYDILQEVSFKQKEKQLETKINQLDLRNIFK